MGIRGLMTLIKRESPRSQYTITIEDLKNKRLAIDSSILLYKFSYGSKRFPDAVVTGFINKTIGYLSGGILPVFVFDGKPPDEKERTIEKRRDERRKLYAKVEALEKDLNDNKDNLTPEEIRRMNEQIIFIRNQIVHVSKEQKDDVVRILGLIGIPIINSPGEAEHTCSALQKTGVCDYTLTDDSDALVFGSTKVIKLTKPSKNNIITVFSLKNILNDMSLTLDEFIDMCILCGCDFCESIPKVGPITAFQLIKKHKNIETVLKVNESINKFTIPQNYGYIRAREIFKQKHPSISSSELSIKHFDDRELRNFLISKEWSFQNIDKIIKRISTARDHFMLSQIQDS